jgi:hypothetical protein
VRKFHSEKGTFLQLPDRAVLFGPRIHETDPYSNASNDVLMLHKCIKCLEVNGKLYYKIKRSKMVYLVCSNKSVSNFSLQSVGLFITYARQEVAFLR